MSERKSLTTLCADLCACIGIEPPAKSEPAHGALKALCGDKPVERIVMYNPDAQAEWLVKKYPELFASVTENSSLAIPFSTVMPSVTPVCFATMYTGVMPEVHGITRYMKPVLTIETIFDALIRAGKKVAIVACEGCSIANIFLEREMDYFILPTCAEVDEQVVQKGMELIAEDKYDFIVIYNGMYDSIMHATSTESEPAMKQLEHHTGAYPRIHKAIEATGRRTLLAYSTDHGVHNSPESGRGTHGSNRPDDIEITHFFDLIG